MEGCVTPYQNICGWRSCSLVLLVTSAIHRVFEILTTWYLWSIDNINYGALNLAIYSNLLFFLPLISSYLLSTMLSHVPVAGNSVFCVTSKYSYFLAAFVKLRNATVSFDMSVCLSAWNNSAPTGRIFMKFGISLIFENLSRKFKFHENRTRITDTLYEDCYTFLLISHSFVLRMRNVSNKSCRENQNTHFVFSIFFPRKVCRLLDIVEKMFWGEAGHR